MGGGIADYVGHTRDVFEFVGMKRQEAAGAVRSPAQAVESQPTTDQDNPDQEEMDRSVGNVHPVCSGGGNQWD